ncbi:MAG: prepilin peptidase [Candidatus Nanoperiomorbaceae bacterium]
MLTLIIVGAVFLFVVGSILGSFIGALIWRLHELRRYDVLASGGRSSKSAVDASKCWLGFWGLSRDADGKKLADKYRHSYCEHCGHKLTAMDLIPLASWLSTVGKCRYCGAKIGGSTLAIELTGGLVFVISYLLWPIAHVAVGSDFANFLQPLNLVQFVVWLMTVLLFLALAFYDARWRKLPNFFTYPLIILSLIYAILALNFGYLSWSVMGDFALALIPVFGVYLLLFIISAGKWIGFGDVKFGLAVALLTMDWRLALTVLVLANVAGTLSILPGLAIKKLTRDSQIAFGPFLIGATFAVVLIAPLVLHWWTNFLML